jgi:hypothetical protein
MRVHGFPGGRTDGGKGKGFSFGLNELGRYMCSVKR